MQPDIVKISTHTGIAASIPYLLGFHPSESLVVIGLEGSRLTFTMRMDLQPAHLEGALVTETVRRMSDYDQVIVAIYTDENSGAKLPRSVLVERLLASLDVREALLVHSDRVWSYLCTDTDCCPRAGRLYRDSSDADAVAAAHIMRGHGPVANRDQLLAALEPPNPQTAAAVLAALPAARTMTAGLSLDERIASLIRLLADSLARLDNPRASLTAGEVAHYLALLDDVNVRDLLIHRLATTDDPAARTLVDSLVAQAPTGAEAEVCAAKSFLAYLEGDGVIAKGAAERALRFQPDHRLAAMLLADVEHGIDPKHVCSLLTR